MFKYIKEILTTFTPKQRILALILLLFSICTITLGPKIITAISHDDTGIYKRLDMQKKLIERQSLEIDSLNNNIIENQKMCTKSVVDREKEILAMIETIEKSTVQGNRVKMTTAPIVFESMNTDDSGIVVKAMLEPPHKDEEENIKAEMLYSGLQSIKAKLKTSIKTHN